MNYGSGKVLPSHTDTLREILMGRSTGELSKKRCGIDSRKRKRFGLGEGILAQTSHLGKTSLNAMLYWEGFKAHCELLRLGRI